MRSPTFTALLCLLCLIVISRANIHFHWVQPTCDPLRTGWNGCLRGQICEVDGTCYSANHVRAIQQTAYSVDGQCGPLNNNLLCDPNSTVYFGTCCSQYGWCGSSDAYCGEGCVSGCSTSVAASPTPSTTALDISIATSNVIHQATTTSGGEPILGEQTSSIAATATAATGTTTLDGTCGATYGNSVCGDWPKGSCCSMYGWCGNTTAHCGDGCQSGPCLDGTASVAPGPVEAPASPQPGSFNIVGQSGVPVMHAALMQNGRAVFLDKVENYTQMMLPDGYYAYSAEYDPATNEAVPLSYKTNAFCSGGIFLANGTLVNVGGNAPLTFIDPTVGDGFKALRYLTRSSTDASLNGQSWSEPGSSLSTARWYASAQIMADGTVFVASGSLNGLDPAVTANNNPTYEVLDAEGASDGQSIDMDILVKNQPYYMYPFLHLLRDGSLFVFVSKSAELFDVTSGSTVKALPDLAGMYRTYPNTGGSVLLPLSSANNYEPDIVICGGGAYQDITSPTDPSCGRIQPLASNATWELDAMPEARTMVEGTLLPDGTVVWLNGCSQGAQGFGLGADPTLEALIYNSSQPLGQRFEKGASSTIPRLYHSVAFLLLDGTIMVAGSNPVEQPILELSTANPYVTEFRVEIYTPPYLSGDNANRRPTGMILSSTQLTADGSTFGLSFNSPAGGQVVSVVLHYNGFITHNLHMGQRMIVLDTTGWQAGATAQTLTVTMPPNGNVAPPGPYVVYVLVDGVPSFGQFVSVGT